MVIGDDVQDAQMPRAQDDIQGCISVARSRMLGATAQERRVIGKDYVDFLTNY